MSNDAITWAKAQHIPSSPQKLLYMLLADRLNDETGECFPGQQLLADEATMSLSQVKVHLKALENARFIERSKRFRADGAPTSDAYTFPGYAEWRKDTQKSARDYHEKHKTATTAGNPPAVDSHRGHSRVSAETTAGNPATNPKRNPKRNPQPMAKSADLTREGELPLGSEEDKHIPAKPAAPKSRGKSKRYTEQFDSFFAAYRKAAKITGRSPGDKGLAFAAFEQRSERGRELAVDMIEAEKAECMADNNGRGRGMLDAVRYLSRNRPEQLFEVEQEAKIENNERAIQMQALAAKLAIQNDNWKHANKLGWFSPGDIPAKIREAVS